MTTKLFVALYVGLFLGMFVLFFTNFPVAWVFFAFVFVTVFGGMMFISRPYVVAAFFLAPALVVLGFGLSALQRSRQVSAWPTVYGVITRSWMCTKTTNGRQVYSGPCIEYEYKVNGVTYEPDSTDTREFAQNLWFSIPGRYKEGREVKVYYDPAEPGISRLEAGLAAGDWATLIIGTVMTLLSAFTLVWVLVTPKGKAQEAVAAAPEALEVRLQPPPRPPKPATLDIANQLDKLVDMHRRGELSEEEFEAAKRKLLGLS